MQNFNFAFFFKNSILSYLSILSGPLLASLCGSFICLVPIRNVLKEPSYWYEDVICRYIAGIPVSTGIIIIRTEYCSNFSFENNKSTYGLLTMISFGVHFAFVIGYYYLWTNYYDYSPPMPFNRLYLYATKSHPN